MLHKYDVLLSFLPTASIFLSKYWKCLEHKPSHHLVFANKRLCDAALEYRIAGGGSASVIAWCKRLALYLEISIIRMNKLPQTLTDERKWRGWYCS